MCTDAMVSEPVTIRKEFDAMTLTDAVLSCLDVSPNSVSEFRNLVEHIFAGFGASSFNCGQYN